MSRQVIPQTLSLQVIPQLMCCLKSFFMHVTASHSPLISPGQSSTCVITSCSLGVCRCTIRVKNTSQSSACVVTSCSLGVCRCTIRVKNTSQSSACVITSCSLGVCRCTIRVKNTSQSSACVTTSHSSVMCHLKSIFSMCHYKLFLSSICHYKLFLIHVLLQLILNLSSQVSPQHMSLQVVPHPCVTTSCSSSMHHHKSFFLYVTSSQSSAYVTISHSSSTIKTVINIWQEWGQISNNYVSYTVKKKNAGIPSKIIRTFFFI